jgi:ferredoxin
LALESSAEVNQLADGAVEVEPSGRRFPIRHGESVFDAASRAGLAWPTRCFGQAQCLSCSFLVTDGAARLSPVEDKEQACLRLLDHLPTNGAQRRMACQATLTGAGTISATKRGVRDRPAANAVEADTT